jgi:HAD superfamily hydrolase (TIGR01509 family)
LPAPRPSAILFDIGRVLVRVDVSAALAGLAAGSTMNSREVWAAIESHPRWHDWQEGRLSAHEWHRQFGQRFGSGLNFEAFRAAWNSALLPEPILPDALVQQLARSFRLAVVSNTDPLHVAHLEANFPVMGHFPLRIYSCGVGVCKPSPLIYKEALRACRAQAQEALFIDDLAENVAAAERLGMAGIVFASASQLEKELTSRDLL